MFDNESRAGLDHRIVDGLAAVAFLARQGVPREPRSGSCWIL
jgi:hypothetical protein